MRHARSPQSRRGTVLLFVLGVLTVIAVAGLSYVSMVKVERRAASAEMNPPDGDRQARIVRDHIAALIAADLFGNKLVTASTPRSFNPDDPNADPIWPAMFEDGEFRDYPDTNFFTFDQSGPNTDAAIEDLLRYDNVRKRFQVAPTDDAWLASTEPIWHPLNAHHWRQITNLRSGYTYDVGDDGVPATPDDRWIRGDGLFVDLGQFFFDSVGPDEAPRGNPSTDLLDPFLPSREGWSAQDSRGFIPGPVPPQRAAGSFDTAPFEQLNFMDAATTTSGFLRFPEFASKGDAKDTRFWADTDGDLRPDARWQVLDELGAHSGLLWVTAARVIDASALVNVNSAIESAFQSTLESELATGRTPADVDLYRLLQESRRGPQQIFSTRYTQFSFPDINTSNILGEAYAFENHVNTSLDLKATLQDIGCAENNNPSSFVIGTGDFLDFNEANTRLNPRAREVLWNWFGSAPTRPRLGALEYGGGGRTNCSPLSLSAERPDLGYPITDILDLHAFSASNHRSLLSAAEQVFDGPNDSNGFLPQRDEDQEGNYGPLRSAAEPADSRLYGDDRTGFANEGLPTANQIRYSTRRLLTPISGASDVSPVPVLNHAALGFSPSGEEQVYAGQNANTRIRLGDFTVNDIPDAYQAFVWALAPLATSEFLSAALESSNVNGAVLAGISGGGQDLSPAYHYGGASLFSLTRGLANTQFFGGQNPERSGAAFAVKTAAALAVNLADATDADDTPSLARIIMPRDNQVPTDAIRSRMISGVPILGNRFSHGDIPPELLDNVGSSSVLGDMINNPTEFNRIADVDGDGPATTWLELNAPTHGLTVVGLERHPYIVEVFTTAAYESTLDGTISPTEGIGAMIMVQLYNPWGETITVDSSLGFWLMEPGVNVDLDPEKSIRFGFPLTDMDPNTVATFFFIRANAAGEVAIGPNENGNADPDIIDEDTNPMNLASYLNALAQVVTTVSPTMLEPHADSRALLNQDLIFFKDFTTEGKVEHGQVLLTRDVPGLGGQAVIDRIAYQGGEIFPKVLVNDFELIGAEFTGGRFNAQYFADLGYFDVNFLGSPSNISFSNPSKWAGRVLLTSSLTRPMENSAPKGGFPTCALDPVYHDEGGAFQGDFVSEVWGNVEPNDTENLGNPVYAHAWLQEVLTHTAPSEAIEYFALDPNHGFYSTATGAESYTLDSELDQEDRKRADNNFTGPSEPWKLFVPNQPLEFVADLHLLSAFAHLCRNNDVLNASAWTTVGQQLAQAMPYDTANPTGIDNPFLATLDPSRYIPEGSAFAGNPPVVTDEALAIPLAVRVFDGFEALDPYQALANGRVNISTAPERTLQMLPGLAPPPDGLLYPINASNDRVRLLLQYRDAWDPEVGESLGFGNQVTAFSPAALTNIEQEPQPEQGLLRRSSDLSQQFSSAWIPTANQPYPFRRGFATAGELAVLDQWAPTGALSANTYPTLNSATQAGFGSALALDNTPITSAFWKFYTSTDPEPTDDVEERLTLFRSISNIVTTRSDVFIAWFVVRGYDPANIEAIQIEQDDAINALSASGDPQFRPAYESRWIAVYDRSEVRQPTDRPKVLLFARLPDSAP